MAEIRKMGSGSLEEVPVRIVNQMIFVRNDSPVAAPEQGPDAYTTAYEYVPNTLIVTLNGMRQREGSDYDYTELGGNLFRFNYSILEDDSVICDYIKIM